MDSNASSSGPESTPPPVPPGDTPPSIPPSTPAPQPPQPQPPSEQPAPPEPSPISSTPPPPPIPPAPEPPPHPGATIPPPHPQAAGGGTGTPPPASQASPFRTPEPPAVPSDKEQRMWATFIHIGGLIGAWIGPFVVPGAPLPLNLLIPLAIWLAKRDGAAFLDDQGKEAVNFQITITLVGVACMISCIGLILLPVIGVYALVVGIIAAIKANDGVAFRYPLTWRVVK